MPIEPKPTSGAPHKAVPRNRLGLVLGAALVAMALGASSAAANPATYNGISADGKVAVFSTEEELASSGDTDHERDVFERSYDESLERYVTREVSIGPTGGNDAQPAQYAAVSAKGDEVFFSTKESLVGADGDSRIDIYVRDLSTNTTTLVSAAAASCEAEGCGNEAFDASFAPGGLTPDGEELFFVTDEKLASADKDSSPDIYAREQALDPEASTTALVSQGAADCEAQGCGNGKFGVSFNAVSTDGSTVVFSSNEPLAEADKDELQDLYARDISTETTYLVSTPDGPGACPENADCKAVYGGVSSDGSHVFFESNEQISEADEDKAQDVYDWSVGGGATLASIGPDGGNGEVNANAIYARNSSDGGAVFFETSEPMDATADKDGAQDVYKHAVGVTTLVSTGPKGGNGEFDASLRWVSPDGSSSAVVFSTAEQLTGADEDGAQDVYERSGEATTLLSTGPTGGNDSAFDALSACAFNALFACASHDGSHVFFITSEKLVTEDTDSSSDIYQRSGGVTALISTGPEGGNGAFGSGLAGVSEDGARAFFTTEERLTEGDPDAELDIYERSGLVTRLVSVGNLIALGPAAPTLTATNPASPGASMTPSIVGQAEPETWIKLYATDCFGEPVAQGTSEELGGSGLAVTVTEGSTTSFRATAEADGLVSPCSASISYKQETPLPPPPPPGSETGTGGGTQAGSGSGGTPAKTHGGVTLVTPETLITFGPAAKTRKRKVVFRFSDATEQPGSSFECKLDRHRWRTCSSPKRLAKLARGRHVFSVKAINALGAPDAQPAKRSFKVAP